MRGVLDRVLEYGPAPAAASGAPAAPAADLESQIELLVAAWSVPAAWQGTTTMGGPMELPATMVGARVLDELVVHGWDLARATGQDPAWDGELLDFVHQQVAETAAMGREMHAYGPEVAVPATAPLLDRTLGLTGRDPFWKP